MKPGPHARLAALAWALPGASLAQTPAAAPPALSAGGMLQVVLGLALVLALLGAGAWLLRRLAVHPAAAGSAIRVLGAAAVGSRERVVLVEVAGTWLVLGVAPGQVRALHSMPKSELARASSPSLPYGDSFSGWLKRTMGKRHES